MDQQGVRALIYLRISQDRTGQQAGVERQREDCERRARERGWTVVEVLTDNDVSASGKRARPGFERMLDLLAKRAADVVVAWALDRLQRNRRDEVALYELCRTNGVTLSLVNGPELDFTSAAGRFVADALGGVARMEIELKGDRQRRAYEQAASKGRWVGGRRPFGYDADGTTIRPEEAAAVRDGFTAVIAGVTLSEVARTWNAAGFRTGQAKGSRATEGKNAVGSGNEWTRRSVRDVLTNPRYAGLRARSGEIVGKALWPAIVTEDTYDAARAILANPARFSGPSARGVRLLSGIALCSVCGAPVHAGSAARPGVPAYRCAGSLGHFARKAEPVDDFVSSVVAARLARPDARDLFIDQDAPDLEALRTESVMLRARQDTLALEFADGGLTASQLRVATQRLAERLTRVEAAMSDRRRVETLAPLVDAADVRAAWDAAPMQRRRAVVALLMDVTLSPVGRGVRNFDPATVEIAWKTAEL